MVTNTPFAIFPVLSLAQMRKSNGGSKCWCLSTNLAVAPTTVAVSCSHHARTGKKKKKSQFYSGIPDELPNSLIFLNPHPSVWASSMFFVVKWALCMKYSCTHGQGPPWGKARAQLRVTSSTSTFPCNAIFIWKNSWPTMVVQTLVSGRNFLEKEQSEPLTSQKTIDSIYWQW